MKILNIALLATLLALIVGCNKDEVAENYFTVSTEKTTYKKGEIINFNFSGNPDFISFYSGELGFNYENKDRNILNGKVELRFSTYMQSGMQLNSLQLLTSSNFNGSFTKVGLKTGTWTDITRRAVLSTGADNTASGVVDISDLVMPYKQMYFAFRKIDTNSPTLLPSQWTVKSFNLDVKLLDDSLFPIATLSNIGWTAIDSLNSTYKWTVSSTALISGGGGLNTPENEDWVVTKALTPLNVAPDITLPVKWIDAKRTDNFSYTYNIPGTYKAVFVTKNQNINSQQFKIKEILLTITN